MAKKRGRIGLNKKGSIVDLVLIGVGLLVFGIAVLLSFKIVNSFNTEVQTNADIPAEAKTSTTQFAGHYSGIIDNSFLFLVIGLAIGAFILAAMVRIHPIFIPIFFIALLFIIFMCGVFSNIYQEMAATTELASEANQLIFISYILEYLPFIVGLLGIVLMIVMYKTYQNAQMV